MLLLLSPPQVPRRCSSNHPYCACINACVHACMHASIAAPQHRHSSSSSRNSSSSNRSGNNSSSNNSSSIRDVRGVYNVGINSFVDDADSLIETEFKFAEKRQNKQKTYIYQSIKHSDNHRCMHACMHACMHHEFVCMHALVCMDACTNACIDLHTLLCMHASHRVHASIDLHARMHACMHACKGLANDVPWEVFDEEVFEDSADINFAGLSVALHHITSQHIHTPQVVSAAAAAATAATAAAAVNI